LCPTGSVWYKTLGATQRDQLLADLSFAHCSQLAAVTAQTTEKNKRAWRRWTAYLTDVGLGHDLFLTGLSRAERHRILSAFAQAVRSARFSAARFDILTAGVVKATISDVAATFRAHDREDPRLDADGEVAFLLQRQFRGYVNSDPGEVPQQALCAEVLEKLHTLASSHLDRCISSLIITGFFFAMRSCEYCSVQGTRRTKIIRLKGIRLFLGKRQLPHSSPILHLATSVTLTFEYQKNDSRNETVTAHKTYHSFMCPVIQLAITVRRLIAMPHAIEDTPINAYMEPRSTKIQYIKADTILKKLRLAVSIMGKDVLGFGPKAVGLHSLRSGVAMAMYLQGIPVYVIMLLGRWSSDAFLRYIRRNVQEFSKGVSQKMIANPVYFTVPSADLEDPRAPNHRLNLGQRMNCGRNADTTPAMAPRVSLWA
jgi:hypothetical protein